MKIRLMALSSLLIVKTACGWTLPSNDPCKFAFNQVVFHQSLEESISAYRVCAAAQPREGFPLYNLGILLEVKGDWSGAQRQFSDAIKIGLNVKLAEAAELQKQITAAHLAASTSEQRSAVRHADMRAEAKLYLKMNQVAPALITARAIVVDPNATWNDLELLGIIEMAAKEYDAATHDLLAAKQRAPQDKQSDLDALLKHSVAEAEYSRLLRTAQVTLNRGDKTKAGDLFATGWRIFPDRTDAGLAAITCYLATPQSNRSLSILDVLVQSADTGVKQRAISLRTSLAEIDKVVFQRRQQAKRIIAAAVARYKAPEDLSDISGKKLAAVEAEAQRALAVDSTMVDAHELLAFCYMREKKYTAAIEQYQAVLSINPKAHVNFWLAWASWKNNQLTEARTALTADMANPTRVDPSLRAALLDDLQLSKSER